MKNIFFVIVLFLFLKSPAQNVNEGFDGHKWEAPYVLDTIKGWGIERFLIPISFAPSKVLRISGLLRVGQKKQRMNTGAMHSYGI